MSILRDIKTLKNIGVLVILFIICVATFSALTDYLIDWETEEGMPSNEGTYNALKFILGFAILLGIGAGVMILLQKKKKKNLEIESEYRLIEIGGRR